MLSRMH